MKKLIYTTLIFSLLSCKESPVPFDQETSDVINTFYSDALELRESYELLRTLSKDIGVRPSGSEGAKKAVIWTKEVMEGYGFDTVYLQEVMVPHWERGEIEEAFFYEGKEKINLVYIASKSQTLLFLINLISFHLPYYILFCSRVQYLGHKYLQLNNFLL